jgi:hypothetical protein
MKVKVADAAQRRRKSVIVTGDGNANAADTGKDAVSRL